MSAILTTTLFVPMVLITMSDGTQLEAVGTAYPTFDACYRQAEADAKLMAREIEAEEAKRAVPGIENVSITCEPMPDGMEPHQGYVPVYGPNGCVGMECGHD